MRRSFRSRVGASFVSASLLVGGAALFGGGTAAGATSVGDEASLRAAFGNAAETDITLTANITLTDCASGTVSRNSATDLTVHGGGFTVTQTCDGAGVFTHGALTGALTFDAITITGGRSTQVGGGIAAGNSTVTLTNSVLTANSTTNASGGGGIYAERVVLVDSVVSNNEAKTAPGNGGGIEAESDVTLLRSTLAGNKAVNSGGGLLQFQDSTTIVESTVSGNTATNFNGGGMEVPEVAYIYNSTISNNTAGDIGGGVLGRGGVVLVYSTVASNSATEGANVLTDNESGITSFGSVVAYALGGGTSCSSPADVFHSQGYNMADDASCAFDQPTDLSGDPLLAALANNGGTRLTRAPQTGSLLLNAIPPANCQDGDATGITTDEIGNPRPYGSGCDIGALELGASPPPGPPAAQPLVVAARFTG